MYREPNVYLTQKNNPKYATGVSPVLMPVIVGSGFEILTKTVRMVKTEKPDEFIPVENITEIHSIGDMEGSSDYSLTTDYSIGGSDNHIVWGGGESSRTPQPGATYYVTVSYTPSESHYEPQIFSDPQSVIDFYGPDIDEAGAFNPVSLGAQLALESGARLISTLKVKISGSTPAAADYKNAIEKHLQFMPDAYRIIPMDLAADINLAIINHVNLMSTPDEKSERVAILGVDHSAEDFTTLLELVGGYATSLANKRVMVIYPDKVTKQLSDGKTYELGAPYIAAALAGFKASQPVERAYTRGKLYNFNSIKGIKMTRSQKNILASRGVTILEQDRPGEPVEIRHGVTTDMSSVQTREASVIDIADYCSKYLRDGLKPYIGQHNITPDFITRLKGNTKTLLSVLEQKGVIIDSPTQNIYQDEINPDTLVVQIVIQVPYPCNYIDIVLYLD